MSKIKVYDSISEYIDSLMLGAALVELKPIAKSILSKIPDVELTGKFTRVTGISNPTKLLKTTARIGDSAITTKMADTVVNTVQQIPGMTKVMNLPSYVNKNTIGRIPGIGSINNTISKYIAKGTYNVSKTLGLKGLAKIAKEQEKIYS